MFLIAKIYILGIVNVILCRGFKTISILIAMYVFDAYLVC